MGTEIRCEKCGHDFRASGHGESCTRIISVTPDELEHIPYSQRSTDVPRSTASSLVISDPALLDDKLLRDLPLKDNARFCGRVRLIKKLGQGGMGAVYRGFDDSLALDVAVKILPVPPGGVEMRYADRFRMEARISAQINHANVVRTRDVGEQGGLVYLVMDYIEGQTARQMLDRKGLIPVPQVLQIIHDATQGMQAAHERGIVHRDIKPENILVAEDGRVLLADLGLAKASGARVQDAMAPITQMGLLLGTPEYMSPEQWDIGAHITPRSDIWSMGVTMWVLLARCAPFEDSDVGQLAKKIKEAPLPDIHELRPDVPSNVAQILYHCMAKNPQRRYMNAAALASALHQAMMHPDQAEAADAEAPQTPSSMSLSSNHDTYQSSQAAVMAQPDHAPAIPAAPANAPNSTNSPNSPHAPEKLRRSESKQTKVGSAVRARPTNMAALGTLRSKSDTRIRQRNGSIKRKMAWGLTSVAAACVAFAVLKPGGLSGLGGLSWENIFKASEHKVAQTPQENLGNSASGVLGSNIELEINAPQRVKAGEKVFLNAAFKGAAEPEKYKIVWRSGKEPEQEGVEIAAQFDADKEYEIRVIESATRKVVARKAVKIETDMQASASEVVDTDNLSAPTRLEGVVRGGGGAAETEVRWIDKQNPNVALSDKTVFEPDLKGQPAGVKIYVFQARRKGAKDWVNAVSDKAWITVKPSVPADYSLAMNDAERLMKEADAAESGAASMNALKEAQKFFERAAKAHPAGDAGKRAVDCLKSLRKETDYAKLMSDAQKLAYESEKTATSDCIRKLEAVNLALKPLYEAQVLFKRTELLKEIKRLEDSASGCKAAIDNTEKSRKDYDDRIESARASVKDAEKYQKLADALPHWEKAYEAFAELARLYPKRNDEFNLEYKKVEDWRNKAYLYTTMGFIPAKPEDPLLKQQNPRNKANSQPVRTTPGITPAVKDTGRLLEQ